MVQSLLSLKKIRGIKLYPGYQYFYPNEEKVYPLYDLCSSQGMPVMFHSGTTYGKKGRLKYAHPLHIDDVAVDFPHMPIIISHLGNPWTEVVREVMQKNKNVYTDISGMFVSGKEDYGHYFKEVVQKLNVLINYCGADHVLFGTDFPIQSYEDTKKLVDSLDITEKQKEEILWKNAHALLKMGLKVL